MHQQALVLVQVIVQLTGEGNINNSRPYAYFFQRSIIFLMLLQLCAGVDSILG